MFKHSKKGNSEHTLKELINWIKSALHHGHTTETARIALIRHGCNKHKVEKATKKVRRELFLRKHLKKILIISTALVLILFIAVSIYYFVYINKPLLSPDMSSFQNSMTKCTRAEYFNEEEEASWNYKIMKKQKDSCIIEVKLLQAKQGELELTKLEGQTMTCTYSLGIVTTPGKELADCTGKLKESLQEIIIKRLHTTVIENLGVIDRSLNG